MQNHKAIDQLVKASPYFSVWQDAILNWKKYNQEIADDHYPRTNRKTTRDIHVARHAKYQLVDIADRFKHGSIHFNGLKFDVEIATHFCNRDAILEYRARLSAADERTSEVVEAVEIAQSARGYYNQQFSFKLNASDDLLKKAKKVVSKVLMPEGAYRDYQIINKLSYDTVKTHIRLIFATTGQRIKDSLGYDHFQTVKAIQRRYNLKPGRITPEQFFDAVNRHGKQKRLTEVHKTYIPTWDDLDCDGDVDELCDAFNKRYAEENQSINHSIFV
jgi:hypothetical protein